MKGGDVIGQGDSGREARDRGFGQLNYVDACGRFAAACIWYDGREVRPILPTEQGSKDRKAVGTALGEQSVKTSRSEGEELSELQGTLLQAETDGEIQVSEDGRGVESDDGQQGNNGNRAEAAKDSSRVNVNPIGYYKVDGKFIATRSGESYNGQSVGCSGYGVYDSTDASILAAPPERYREWPCGTILRICTSNRDKGGGTLEEQPPLLQGAFLGDIEVWPSGVRCLYARRVDSCPGCGKSHIDLSEAGLWGLCGYVGCGRLDGLEVEVVSRP